MKDQERQKDQMQCDAMQVGDKLERAPSWGGVEEEVGGGKTRALKYSTVTQSLLNFESPRPQPKPSPTTATRNSQ